MSKGLCFLSADLKKVSVSDGEVQQTPGGPGG